MKKKRIAIALVAALLLVGAVWFQNTYIILGIKICRRDATELDLSGIQLKNVSGITQLRGLEKLDLRGTGLRVESYEQITAAFPECEVLWEVPFQGEYLDPHSESLTIDSITEEEMEVLGYFTGLKTLDMRSCADYTAAWRLQQMYPEVDVAWTVPFQGVSLNDDIEILAISSVKMEEMDKLQCLSKLKTIDARGCSDLDAVMALQETFPQYQVLWLVDICGSTFDQDTKALEIADADAEELMKDLCYLPQLQSVTLTGTVPDNDAVLELKQAYPEVTFIWDFQLCGVTVSSDAVEIDLSNIKMESVDAVENSLKYFNRLERVIMCKCGISSEEMDALWKRNPEVRFVWSVRVGSYWVRTDVTTFMPWKLGFGRNGAGNMNNSHCGEMKYLVDVVCMDLGHMDVKDLSFLNYMPNMEYLLLCENYFSDITPMASLKKLKYLEMFENSVKDLSPLASCTALEDLNLCYNPFQDVTPLLELENLQNIWLSGWMVPKDQLELLYEAFPDATIVHDSGRSTGRGWRDLPNYHAQRDLLELWYMTTPG